jgi:phosphate transport system substrate-binding protein
MSFKTLIGAAAGFTLAVFASQAEAADMTGAGATAPFPIYQKWAAAYKDQAGVGLSYQAIGSGGGIKKIEAKTVTFGATDAPLKPEDLDKFGLAQFPTVIGGILPVVNLPGVKAGSLVLDGPTLAAIYLGQISNWSDPAIKKLNPALNLPDLPIGPAYRNDKSGTTFVFTSYLSRVSDAWKTKVGASTTVKWPAGMGAKGNEGVAGNVMLTAGAIGYVEYIFAKQNRLAYARMINKSGQTVSPSVDTLRAAAQNTDWAGAAGRGFNVDLLDQSSPAAWPITATTYILVYKKPSDPAATADVLKFFKWSYEKGGEMALDLNYVPLPDSAVQAIKQSWKQVQGSGM